MTRREYLIARGWRTSGTFVDGEPRWVDPYGSLEGFAVFRWMSEEDAEDTQLARDVDADEYVRARTGRSGWSR